jgi:cation:H+ antiporter
MLAENLLILAVGLAALIKSSEVCVRNLAALARYFCLSEFAISFIVVGVASVLPELSVATVAAAEGSANMAVAVLFGSNIADLTLILGLVAVYARGLKVESKVRHGGRTLLALLALPIVLLLLGNGLSKLDGVILIVAYFYYLRKIIGRHDGLSDALCSISNNKRDFARHLAAGAIAMAVLFASAGVASDSAIKVATAAGLPEVLIGFLIALGTCSPEFTLAIQAVRKGHSEMGTGDLVGNVSTDATLSLGIVVLFSPLAPTFSAVALSGMTMVAAGALAIHFMQSGRKVSTREGMALVLAYIAFIALEFALQGRATALAA